MTEPGKATAAELLRRSRSRPVLAVFSEQRCFWWQRFLKPGFRHCSAILDLGEGWLLFDPLSNATAWHRLPPSSKSELIAAIRGHGSEVIELSVRPVTPRVAHFAPYTCVEAVKRCLGVSAPHVLTPWQLFRWLSRQNQKKFI